MSRVDRVVLGGLLITAGVWSGAGRARANEEGRPILEPGAEGRIAFDGGAALTVGWADFDDNGDQNPMTSRTARVWLTEEGPVPSGGAQAARPVTTTTTDGVTIYGEPYFGDLPASAPLVLLFHQGGSNGRGEYGDLAPWLNSNGFRAIAWDQRAGGSVHGDSNRTVADLGAATEPAFCDAAPDLQAALDYVIDHGVAETVVVWGSSYSGSLAFGLAAENPDRVRGVLAFSPASGPPMVGCQARRWVNDIDVPMLVFRPESELERPSSVEQREILTSAGAEFRVVEHGVHGSSMLLDDRTGRDMSATREAVVGWLNEVVR